MAFGGRLVCQFDAIWDDNNWETENASNCCEGEIEFDDDYEATCLICGEECETIMLNASEIEPAKTKII